MKVARAAMPAAFGLFVVTVLTAVLVAYPATADAASVIAGSALGYTVTLSNVGNLTATGVSFTDNLPSGAGVDWHIDVGGSDSGWSVTGSPPNEHLVYSPTTLAAGTSTHAHVVSDTSSGTCGTVYSNTASVTTNNAGSGSATATITESPTTYLGENFDGVTPPALPAGWVAANAQGPAPLWVTSSSGNPPPPADSAPNAAFVDDLKIVAKVL